MKWSGLLDQPVTSLSLVISVCSVSTQGTVFSKPSADLQCSDLVSCETRNVNEARPHVESQSLSRGLNPTSLVSGFTAHVSMAPDTFSLVCLSWLAKICCML